MKEPAKFLIYTGLCLILAVSLISFDNQKSPSSEHIYNISDNQKSPQSEAEIEVSTENSPTEKYILRYDESKDSVLLITKKEDGTEVVTTVESINPYYLTSEDINTLTAGIELVSREDMFILIEDLSS